MRKSLLILLLGLAGCVATSKKENLGRPDFSKPRPVKNVAPVTTAEKNHSFTAVDKDRAYKTNIGGRTYLVFKVTHFQDLGPVRDAEPAPVQSNTKGK